jgi:hypothetical protein
MSRVVESAEDKGPVESVGLSIAGQKARVLDKVVAGKDWLKSLTLKFKNTHTFHRAYYSTGRRVACPRVPADEGGGDGAM